MAHLLSSKEASLPLADGSSPALRFFTAAEVAGILRMHTQVITRKLQAGQIAGYKLGKDWRVSEAQLHDFLARNSNQRKILRPSKLKN